MLCAAGELAPARQVRHILAGTAARTCAQVCIHPIDTVKTRLQARPRPWPWCHFGDTPGACVPHLWTALAPGQKWSTAGGRHPVASPLSSTAAARPAER